VTFAREAEAKFLGNQGFLLRNDQQFHWHNDGYKSFEDFLGSLNSRHRKAIKRERREAVSADITIHRLTAVHNGGRLGRLLCVLYGDRFTQMGPALSHAEILSR